MRRLFLFLLLLPLAARAQLTLTLTSVPANTPAADPVFVAGTFNNWNPADPAFALQRQPSGQYTLTLPGTVRGAVEFKFTRGSWARVEATASGADVPNRSFSIPASGAASFSGSVAAWKDLTGGGGPPVSTATASVSILSNAFVMPQLGGRTRRIWLHLPPDYATSTKTYPVLYMHDGQNLFDAATSFSGEWQVDETLDGLQSQGDWGCIVVGIDNGGTNRLNEYSPYVNAQYGGGQGDAYVRFIAETLKPFVDARYRTRPDRLNTGILGSSMGGLISLYAALRYPEVFGRAGVFSPSLWFSPDIYALASAAQPRRPDPRLFLLSGAQENGAGQTAATSAQVRDQRRMLGTLAGQGFRVGFGGPAEVDSLVRADGTHAEWFWRREFGAAYQRLFRGSAPLAAASTAPAASTLELFPNPATHELTVRGAGPSLEMLDARGRVVRRATLRAGQAQVDVRGLAPGAYRVRVGRAVRGWTKE